MTIYTLTCINEAYEVIAVKAYTTREGAEMAMRREYESERSCFYADGTLSGSDIQWDYARVNYGDGYFYDWTIKNTELAL